MTVFQCSLCGAEFCGDLREASEAAFRHSGECPGVARNNLPAERAPPPKSIQAEEAAENEELN